MVVFQPLGSIFYEAIFAEKACYLPMYVKTLSRDQRLISLIRQLLSDLVLKVKDVKEQKSHKVAI